MRNVKALIKKLIPQSLLDAYRRLRYPKWYDPKGESVEAVFTQVYKRGLWGKGEQKYYSGPGSDPNATRIYVDAVRSFIASNDVRSVLDLGCGDFRVGAQLLSPTVTYIGVDVVKPLINYNRRNFGGKNVSFICGNILEDDLPTASLCLIRQVLQHLSNEQIQIVLHRTKQYRFLLVTEHRPAPSHVSQPNLDIHHGHEIRMGQGSFVQLDAPPFNQEISRILCEVVLEDGSLLQTVLIENNASP